MQSGLSTPGRRSVQLLWYQYLLAYPAAQRLLGRVHSVLIHVLTSETVDVDSKNDEGWTALMMASHNGHTQVVRLLIQNGADVAARSQAEPKRTALLAAAEQGHADIVKLLLQVSRAVVCGCCRCCRRWGASVAVAAQLRVCSRCASEHSPKAVLHSASAPPPSCLRLA